MEFALIESSGQFKIEAYREGCIIVNGQSYVDPFIIGPETFIHPWRPSQPKDITLIDLDPVFRQNPQVVLLGTGNRLQFPSKAISQAFFERGFGIEAMDSRAACRSYSLLLAEGRNVLAILFPFGSKY